MNIHLPAILMFTRCQGFDNYIYTYHDLCIYGLDRHVEASTSSAQTHTEKSSILSSIPSISKGPDWSGEAMHEEIQQGRDAAAFTQ